MEAAGVVDLPRGLEAMSTETLEGAAPDMAETEEWGTWEE
jgi:hypothetical protein